MTRADVAPPARRGLQLIAVWGLVGLFAAVCVWNAVTHPDGLWWVLGWVGYPVVGAVILSSRPGNVVGRLLMAIGMAWVLPLAAQASLPTASTVLAWVEVLAEFSGYVTWLLLVVLVAVFPTGRTETRVGRVIVAAAAIAAVVMAAVALVDPAPLEMSGTSRPWAIEEAGAAARFLADEGGFWLIPLLMIAALGELGVRWRRADGSARLQFRWFAFGVAVTVASIVVSMLTADLPVLLVAPLALMLNAMPVSIGIAVTRHGLYEINRVVSRTVSYAIVTALVIAVYAAAVTSATALLPQASALAVAVATLIAAALFLPVLRWVQRRLDRRFDRERYDAQKVVDEFGERLRTEIDPSTTASDLARAAERTLQPTSVGVWTVAS